MNADNKNKIAYRFEVGQTYNHTFEGEARTSFLCTARDGDLVTLVEQGGKGRTFKDTAGKAETWNGYNECIPVGIIHEVDFTILDHIVAHDFLEGRE